MASINPSKAKVLLVDNDSSVLKTLSRDLAREGIKTLTSTSAEEALKILEQKKIHVVIADEHMPKMRGLEFLSICKKRFPESRRMLITGHPNIDLTISAINTAEVFRFYKKPCNAAEVAVGIREAVQKVKELQKDLKAISDSGEQLQNGENASNDLDENEVAASGIFVIDEDCDLDKVLQEFSSEED